ncbi:unnamed protein product [Gadus morhua 'NCC']
MAEGAEAEDEIQFLRTDDEVVLQCSATLHKEQQKLCLAAEGFGNRLCFLESTSNSKNVPPDLSICAFVLEQSLSVRALQEMLANTEEKAEGHVDVEKWRSPSMCSMSYLSKVRVLVCVCFPNTADRLQACGICGYTQSDPGEQ